MIRTKKLLISGILIIITVFFIWYIILDFSRFINNDYIYDIYPSALLKRINVLLSALIAWIVGKDGLCPNDSRRMKTALLFACLGEGIFLTGKYVLGVVMFGVCQTILIIRNSTGMRAKLAHASLKQKKSLIISGLIALPVLILLTILFKSLTRMNGANLVIYTYGILLSMSLLSGLFCRILMLLPRKNSRRAVYGSFCFFCCDILVGLDALLPLGLPWLIANSFIWVFYIPALVLLSLSSYR